MNYIAELKYPGSFIAHQDENWAWSISKLIRAMDASLLDAVISLCLYEQAEKINAEIINTELSVSKRIEKGNQIENISQSLKKEQLVDNFDFYQNQLLSEQARIHFMKSEMEKGKFPEKYQRRLVFIHARSFLYSLDRIDKIFEALKKENGVPDKAIKAEEEFKNAFPNLRGVRNSSAHIDYRIRGLARSKEIFPNGGSIWLENLSNNKFGSVMEHGNHGEVEVSFNSIISARDCIQMTIDSFQWKGSPQISP